MNYRKIRNTRCVNSVVASSSRLVAYDKIYTIPVFYFKVSTPLERFVQIWFIIYHYRQHDWLTWFSTCYFTSSQRRRSYQIPYQPQRLYQNIFFCLDLSSLKPWKYLSFTSARTMNYLSFTSSSYTCTTDRTLEKNHSYLPSPEMWCNHIIFHHPRKHKTIVSFTLPGNKKLPYHLPSLWQRNCHFICHPQTHETIISITIPGNKKLPYYLLSRTHELSYRVPFPETRNYHIIYHPLEKETTISFTILAHMKPSHHLPSPKTRNYHIIIYHPRKHETTVSFTTRDTWKYHSIYQHYKHENI